jgi:hypothetical protein
LLCQPATVTPLESLLGFAATNCGLFWTSQANTRATEHYDWIAKWMTHQGRVFFDPARQKVANTFDDMHPYEKCRWVYLLSKNPALFMKYSFSGRVPFS